ncbi:MAG: desulfoferrodoxin [Planctomycetes bacterium]|nr:desulfoferrodoxin [Planctomycetota bacterium]
MTARLEIYKCMECGNIVEVQTAAGGDLQCCGNPMKLLEEQTADSSKEKHVPVIEKVDGGYKVKVGSVPHPMEEKHYIEWIELQVDNKVLKAYLKPGDAPEACFCVCGEPKTVVAREYCNVHSLWKS